MPRALAQLRAGRPVLVVDDAQRENEGDIVLAAQHASAQWVAWTVRYSSGLLCAPMPAEIADRLALPVMVARNEDPRGTAYTVTVDARHGVSTGISAADRAWTARVLADPGTGAAELVRPGHVLPLRASAGGVLERPGHTEAAVDLCRLAGLQPVALIAEAVLDDGRMMRLSDVLELGERYQMVTVTIADLAAWRRHHDNHPSTDHPSTDQPSTDQPSTDQPSPAQHRPTQPGTGRPPDGAARFGVPGLVEGDEVGGGETSATGESRRGRSARVVRVATAALSTRYGTFTAHGYRDELTGAEHLALVSGDPRAGGSVVRVHSECLTGDAFGSLRCDCGPQLTTAMAQIAQRGGVVVYLQGHEGRGLGLLGKLAAYALQDQGHDTVDANVRLGYPADAREYGAAAAVLRDLGIDSVRLLTNNPAKVAGLAAHGVQVVERFDLLAGRSAQNVTYLATKRDRMGHTLPADSMVHPEVSGGEHRPGARDTGSGYRDDTDEFLRHLPPVAD
ncbi:MAG: GTP cyclohydrolase II [Angustibacter sp.]